MIIAVDLTPLAYHITGVERYALCVTEQMLEMDKENTYYLVFKDNIHTTFERFIDGERIKSVIVHGENKIIFWYITRLFSFYKIRADKYLFFSFAAPLLLFKKGIYNTIHDLASWDVPDSMKLYQLIASRVERRMTTPISEGIFTVSNFSKERIKKILKYKDDRIFVVPSGLSDSLINAPEIDFSTVKEKYRIPNRYIMALSTIEPKKNLDLLINAYLRIKDRVNFDLVLVGRMGWKTEEFNKKYGETKGIHITGFVSDEEAKCIYKNAICFVFPSIYEGFGLPPIEALALGTPVIASNAASIPEVLMDRALYFESNNLRELKDTLLKLPILTSTMNRSLNEVQINEYNFTNSARKVLKIIQGNR